MLREEISNLRQQYDYATLEEQNALDDPIKQFELWFAQAAKAKIFEHNAMTLATCNNNVPDARIVLLKSFDENGFVFFTNYNSAKGQELAANPQAALVFLWKNIERQVRIRGTVKKVDAAVSRTYFESRPIDSQCGAIASDQSSEIVSRQALNEKFEAVQKKYANEKPEMPEHWGGFVVVPSEIEFWQGRKGRMHDRILYTKNENKWQLKRLQP